MEHISKNINLAAAIVVFKNKILLARRAQPGTRSGLWELPSVVIKPGEKAPQVLQTGIEVGFRKKIKVGKPVAVGQMPEGDSWLTVTGYSVEIDELPSNTVEHDQLQWVGMDELSEYGLGGADLQIALVALSNGAEVIRLDLGSFIRIAMLAHFGLGVLVALGVVLLSVFSRHSSVASSVFTSLISLIAIPLLYAVIGALLALVAVLVYNFFAQFIGGLKIEFRRS